MVKRWSLHNQLYRRPRHAESQQPKDYTYDPPTLTVSDKASNSIPPENPIYVYYTVGLYLIESKCLWASYGRSLRISPIRTATLLQLHRSHHRHQLCHPDNRTNLQYPHDDRPHPHTGSSPTNGSSFPMASAADWVRVQTDPTRNSRAFLVDPVWGNRTVGGISAYACWRQTPRGYPPGNIWHQIPPFFENISSDIHPDPRVSTKIWGLPQLFLPVGHAQWISNYQDRSYNVYTWFHQGRQFRFTTVVLKLKSTYMNGNSSPVGNMVFIIVNGMLGDSMLDISWNPYDTPGSNKEQYILISVRTWEWTQYARTYIYIW